VFNITYLLRGHKSEKEERKADFWETEVAKILKEYN